MAHFTSEDGTPIAYDTIGAGPVVVVVNGAMSKASDAAPLAQALADAGFTGVVFDRRARGDSGDTRPYSPEREAEDLAAVISATGGTAAVLGHRRARSSHCSPRRGAYRSTTSSSPNLRSASARTTPQTTSPTDSNRWSTTAGAPTP